MKLKRGILLWLFAGSITITGCLETLNELDTIQPFKWNPKLALPLINSTFSLGDLIHEFDSANLVEVGEDDLITLVYQSYIESPGAEQLYAVANQDFNVDISMPSEQLVNFPVEGTVSYQQEFVQDFKTFGSTLDSVFLKEGKLELTLSTDMPVDGHVVVTLNSMTRNGNVVIKEFEWVYSGTEPVQQIRDTLDLKGLKIDLTNGDERNKFTFNIEVELTYRNVPVTELNGIQFDMAMAGPKFSRIHGTLQPVQVISKTDSLEISLFQDMESGVFSIEAPIITFNLNNSFGLPVAVDLNTIWVQRNEQVKIIDGSITSSPFLLQAPGVNEIGTYKESELSFTPDNSNIKDLLNFLPHDFMYRFKGVLNPDNIEALFVTDSSSVKINYEVEVPLYGSVKDLIVTEEFSFDGSILEDADKVAFKLKVLNELPAGFSAQVYFLNDSEQILDSLTDDEGITVNPAPVDADGISVLGSESVEIVKLNRGKIENAKEAEAIRIKITSNTTDSDKGVAIKILSSNKLNVSLSVQTKLEVEL